MVQVLLLFLVPAADSLASAALPHLHEDGLVLEPLRRLLGAVRAHVAAAFGLTARYVVPLGEERFHRTTSGKIQRTA